MRALHPKYIMDESGKKLSVILPYQEYEKIIAELSEKHPDELQRETTGTASALRGKISLMTNAQIDKQFNEMRSEWQKDS